MIVPDIIIAGAPKCGTTSLFKYLAAHPSICPSKVKETYYLMDPGYPLYNEDYNYHLQGIEGYAKYFDYIEDNKTCLRLEATPDYLYQHTPLDALQKFDSVPEIIFILRKPSKRIYSLFSYAKHSLAILDKNLSFREYLDMVQNEDKTLEGRVILLGAIDHSKYSNYLSLWYDCLPSDRIHVFLFEDMVVNPAEFTKRIARTLGIDEEFYSDYSFDRSNVTFEVKSRWLQNLNKTVRNYLPAGRMKTVSKDLYNRLNLRRSRSAITAEEQSLLYDLDKLFESSSHELEKLTGLDLISWR